MAKLDAGRALLVASIKTMKLNGKKAKKVAKVPKLLADNPHRETLILGSPVSLNT